MSRSKIRTATQTAGQPRRRKWSLRALTTVVAAAGALSSLAGPAQAYDASVCDRVFGAANVFDADLVRINTNKRVDFGDLPHSGPGSGAPQGDAVICWADDGRVFIVGRLFYDTVYTGWDASVDLRGFNGPTPVPGWRGLWTVAGSPGVVTNRLVQERWQPEFGLQADRIHIQLALRQQPTGESTVVLHDSDYYRGD